MRKQWMLGLAVALSMAGLGSAQAASVVPVSMSDVSGTWTGVDPTNVAGLNGIGSSTVQWGKPGTGAGQSGYGFQGAAASAVTAGTEFDLGTFTHFNRPIYANTSIRGATLKVAFEIMIGTKTELIDVVFDFIHEETDNAPRGRNAKCADGGKKKVGVNRNGCADKVTVRQNVASTNTYVIDGMTYVLEITGLLYDGQTLSHFWTTENLANSAILRAKFTILGNPIDPPPPPSTVPLPAGGSLLLLGLAGLAAVRRFRRAA